MKSNSYISADAKIKNVSGFYKVVHRKFATDRYQYGITIVKAYNKEDALMKLNRYLEKKPNGTCTDLPCESILNVCELNVLE